MTARRLVLVSLLAAMLAVAREAQAAPPACGYTVPANTTLTLDGDMICNNAVHALYVSSGSKVIGNGFKVVANAAGYVSIYGTANDVVIENVVVEGNTQQDGIQISGARNVVRNVTARGRRYGVYLIGSDNTIEGSTATGNTSGGFIIGSGTNATFRNNVSKDNQSGAAHYNLNVLTGTVIFTNNRSEGTAGSSIRFDGSNGIVLDNATAGNTFVNIAGNGLVGTGTTNVTVRNWVLNGGNITGGDLSGVHVTGSGARISNVRATNFTYGIRVLGSGMTIENNVATNNINAGLYFGDQTIVVQNNDFSGNRNYSAQTSGYQGTITFRNNDLRNSPRGLQFDNLLNVTLDNTSNGNVLGTNTACGICGSNFSGVTVRGWDFSGAGRIGSGVSLSGANSILENVTADDRDNGIVVSGDGWIVRSSKTRRAGWGIWIQSSTSATVRDNDMSGATAAALRFSTVSGSIVVSNNDLRNSYRALYADGLRDLVLDNAAAGITPNLLGTNPASVFELYNATRLTVRNWNFPGTGTGAGVAIAQGSENVIENITTTGRSVGVSLGGTGSTVRNCNLTGSGSYNVILGGSSHSLENNVLRGGTGQAIRFENYTGAFTWTGNDLRDAATGVYFNNTRDFVLEQPATGAPNAFGGNSSSGVSIASNCNNITVKGLELSGVGVGYGVYSDAPNTTVLGVTANQRDNAFYMTNTGTTLRDCSGRRATTRGLRVFRGGATIVGNELTDAGSSGINFYDYAGPVVLEDNDLRGSAHGMYIELTRNLVLDNAAGALPNLMGSNTTSGISGNGDSNVIRNWDLSGGGAGYGISISGVNNTVENVTASNRTTGIELNGRGVTVKNCTVRGARNDAVVVYQPVATIAGNVLTGAGRYGIYLVNYAGEVSITGNDLTGSATGIQLNNVLDVDVDQSGGAAGTPNVFGDNAICGVCGSGTGVTLTGLDVTGRGSGYGISIAGNNNVLRRITASKRNDGVFLNGLGNLIDDSLMRDDNVGVRINGTASTVSNSRMCWNSAAGLHYDGADVTEAKNNFWGTPSGPKNATNPEGTGNAVTGNGRTLYLPFLTEGTGCESNLAVRTLELTGLVDAPAGTLQTVRVRALDRYGAVVDGYAGTVAFQSNDPAAVLPSSSTLTLGVKSFPVTLKTAGSRTLTVYEVGTPDLVTTVRVNVTPNPAAARLTLLSGNAQSAAAGSTLPLPLKVKLDDAYGNVLSAKTVTFAATTGGGSVSASQASTDVDGVASMTAKVGNVVGANAFTATFAGATGSPVTFSATGVPGEVSRLSLTGLPATIVAGVNATVRVRAYDALDNLVTGYTGPVQFASTDAQAQLPAESTLTGGDRSFTVSFRKAGAQQLSVADVRYVAFRTTASTTVTAAAAKRLVLLSGNGQVVEAGLVAPDKLIVGAVDDYGNGVAGVNVTFAAVSGGGSIAPATVATDALGAAGATPTVGTREGANDYTAAAAGLAGSPVRFQVIGRAGAPALLVYVSGGGLSGRVNRPLLAPLVVLTADKYGNRVGNTRVKFRALSEGASVAPAEVTSDSAGLAQATATLGSLAGVQRYEAFADFATNVVVYEETAVEGDASSMRLLSGDGQEGQVGQPLAERLRVIVEDANGNPVPRVSILFSATAAGATVNPAIVATDPNGVAETVATLGRTVGAVTFNAGAPGLANSPVTFNATAGPGPAKRLVVRGVASPIAAGTAAQAELEAFDEFDNRAISYTGPVTLTSTDLRAQLGGPVTLVEGLGSAPVTFATAGTQELEGRDAAIATLRGKQTGIVVTAAPAAMIRLTVPTGTQVAGSAVRVGLQIVDENGNPSAGAKVVTVTADNSATFSGTNLAESDGLGTDAVTGTTDAEGRAELTLTSLAAGEVNVEGSGTELTSASAVVKFVPGTADRLVVEARDGSSTIACECLTADVRLADTYGNVVATAMSGVVLTVSGSATITETDLGSAAGTLPGTSVKGRLNVEGKASVVVCGADAERVELTASHPQLAGRDGVLTLDFALGELSPTNSLLASDAARVQTRQGSATVTLTPKDECGNDLGPGHEVELTTTLGTLSDVEDKGDGTYVALFGIEECPGADLSTSIAAKVDGTAVASPVAIAIECVPLSATKTDVTLSRPTTPLCADTKKSRIGVTVVPRDDNGRPLGASAAVTVTMDGLVGGEFAEDGAGGYVGEISADACSATAKTVTVKVNGVEVPKDGLTATFTCPTIDPVRSSVAVERTEIRADGVDATKVIVAAVNECGEPAAGGAATLAVKVGVLAATQGTLDVEGHFETKLTAKVEGLDELTATVDGVTIGTREVKYRAPVRYGGGLASCDCASAPVESLFLLVGLAVLLRRRKPSVRA